MVVVCPCVGSGTYHDLVFLIFFALSDLNHLVLSDLCNDLSLASSWQSLYQRHSFLNLSNPLHNLCLEGIQLLPTLSAFLS